MNMRDVESSNIAAIGHDEATKTMRVRFKSGAEYDYHGVESTVFDRLVNAPSAGRFFATHIKDRYGFKKISKE